MKIKENKELVKSIIGKDRMIRQLYNPITPKYIHAKNLVADDRFAWYYNKVSTIDSPINRESDKIINSIPIVNMPFYSHILLARPDEDYYTMVLCQTWEDIFLPMLKEIILANKLKVNMFCRACLNCVEPSNEAIISEPHLDHPFDHKNLIVYLNDAGGPTIIIDQKTLSIIDYFEPTEDSIITFSGVHCMRPSTKKRRIILVATYI